MTQDKLKEVIELHLKWIKNEDGGIRANLSYANLIDANLSGAYLSGANLSGAIKMQIYCKWSHGITDNIIHIGCIKRTIEQWDEFFASNDVIQTERGTQEFKQIQAVYNAYKAYMLTLNNK